jgi:hypothetical protein
LNSEIGKFADYGEDGTHKIIIKIVSGQRQLANCAIESDCRGTEIELRKSGNQID